MTKRPRSQDDGYTADTVIVDLQLPPVKSNPTEFPRGTARDLLPLRLTRVPAPPSEPPTEEVTGHPVGLAETNRPSQHEYSQTEPSDLYKSGVPEPKSRNVFAWWRREVRAAIMVLDWQQDYLASRVGTTPGTISNLLNDAGTDTSVWVEPVSRVLTNSLKAIGRPGVSPYYPSALAGWMEFGELELEAARDLAIAAGKTAEQADEESRLALEDLKRAVTTIRKRQ